jgi:hypothetical protein
MEMVSRTAGKVFSGARQHAIEGQTIAGDLPENKFTLEPLTNEQLARHAAVPRSPIYVRSLLQGGSEKRIHYG